MQTRNLIILLFMAIFHADLTLGLQFPGLQTIFSFFGGGKKGISDMTEEEIGVSKGLCTYDFLWHISYADRNHCQLEDESILHLLETRTQEEVKKPPIMVKCIQPEPAANASQTTPVLLQMQKFKDILNLLKPIGNATKRHELGSCVVIFFYTDTSVACTNRASHVNILPLQFPTLRIAAVDAMNFRSFNTDFGIIGLPTLLLFHQGRPVIKYNNEENTYANFITRHTGIDATEPSAEQLAQVEEVLPSQPVERRDYVLCLAWLFILNVLLYLFINSAFCKQIIEMIKRNWRESEAQLEH